LASIKSVSEVVRDVYDDMASMRLKYAFEC